MFHVPTFIFISFYFYYNNIASRDNYKILQKFKRLLIPYIIWPFIFLILDNTINKIFNIKIFGRRVTLKEYFYQIILGHKFYNPFFYISVFLFLSILFTIIGYIFKNNFLLIIQIFGIFIYMLHHLGIEIILMKYNLFCLLSNSIIQLTPTAVVGFSAGAIKIIHLLKGFYIQALIISFLLLICLFKFDIFLPQEGNLYKDIELNTFGAINLFILFSSIPLEKVQSKRITSMIKLISYNTGGIYYIHYIIFSYLVNLIKIFNKNGILRSIIIYLINHFICFIGSKIFDKYIIKFLFI